MRTSRATLMCMCGGGGGCKVGSGDTCVRVCVRMRMNRTCVFYTDSDGVWFTAVHACVYVMRCVVYGKESRFSFFAAFSHTYVRDG